METRPDLIELFEQTIKILDEAMVAYSAGKTNQLNWKVWKVASDVEYALFFLSFERNTENDSWKDSWRNLNINEVETLLIASKKMMKKTIVAIESESSGEDTYRMVWIARRYLLKVQECLSKL